MRSARFYPSQQRRTTKHHSIFPPKSVVNLVSKMRRDAHHNTSQWIDTDVEPKSLVERIQIAANSAAALHVKDQSMPRSSPSSKSAEKHECLQMGVWRGGLDSDPLALKRKGPKWKSFAGLRNFVMRPVARKFHKNPAIGARSLVVVAGVTRIGRYCGFRGDDLDSLGLHDRLPLREVQRLGDLSTVDDECRCGSDTHGRSRAQV